MSAAVMHRSVYERFDGPPVQQYDRMAPYRPETLRSHVDFANYYSAAAKAPSTTLKDATAMAGEPIPSGDRLAHDEPPSTKLRFLGLSQCPELGVGRKTTT